MPLATINWRPDARVLRQFGLFGAGVSGLLAAAVVWRGGLLGVGLSAPGVRALAGALVAAGAVLLAAAAVWPRALKGPYLALTLVTFPIGLVVSHVIMAVIYFGVFTPVAIYFRLVGRDALHRRIDRQAASYWSPREPTPELKRYFRQY